MALWLTGHREPDLLSPELAKMLGREKAAEELQQKVERAVWALQVLQRALGRDRDAKLAAPARRELESFLSAGLELRIGAPLVSSAPPPPPPPGRWVRYGTANPGTLDIYNALRAGGLEPPEHINVCADCATVFESRRPRASKCDRCHRSPRPRPELRPWHMASHAQETFDPDTGEPLGWSVAYAGSCQGCGARFDSTDARQRYCANCGGGPGRKRRHRGSDSTRGRQLFRFEGPPNLSGFSDLALPDGTPAELRVDGRIVETSDAEAAKVLDHFPQLRRL